MIVSAKGRYALRVMINLAQRPEHAFVPLKEIAEEEGISLKYLEAIMTTLSKGGLVSAVHGKNGGYRLNRKPDAYTVGSILKQTEVSLAAVSCAARDPEECPRAGSCATRPIWDRLDAMIDSFFESITLADILRETKEI